MNDDEIDDVIKCVAFITMVAGPPAGPEHNGDKRRWVWTEDDNDVEIICLVLTKNEYHVEIDLEEVDHGHPRYYTLIGWCALHRIPCFFTLGDDHWMRVAIETDTEHEGTQPAH
jgi:hypothetical protein